MLRMTRPTSWMKERSDLVSPALRIIIAERGTCHVDDRSEDHDRLHRQHGSCNHGESRAAELEDRAAELRHRVAFHQRVIVEHNR